MGSDPSCDGYFCHTLQQCVQTLASYTSCMTGRDLGVHNRREYEQTAHADAGLGAGTGSACNITGVWDCGGTACFITETGTSVAVVATSPHPPTWKSATGTVSSSGHVALQYVLDSGQPAWRGGIIAPSCCAITWNDTSVWTSPDCPNAVLLDVHIVAHTHVCSACLPPRSSTAWSNTFAKPSRKLHTWPFGCLRLLSGACFVTRLF